MAEPIALTHSAGAPSPFAVGRVRICTANEAIRGGATGTAWFVRRGAVDLFAVTRDAEGRESARLPLGRFAPGEVILALPPHEIAGGARGDTVLIGTRDCEVVESNLADVLAAGVDVTADIEAWRARLHQMAPHAPSNVDEADPWSELEALHRIVAAALVERRAEHAGAATERAMRRAAGEQTLASKAVARAGDILTDQVRPGDESLQHTPGDPLASAFARVAGAMGVTPERMETGAPDGDAEARVRRLARANDMTVRRVLLRDAWWQDENGPLIAFLGKDRIPQALIQAPGGGYTVIDGATGQHAPVTETVAKDLAGDALMLYRGPTPQPTRMGSLFKIAISGLRSDLLRILAMGLGVALLGLATPLITGHLVENVIPTADTSRLLEATLALTMIALGGGAFTLVQGVGVLRAEGRIDRVLQSLLFQRLLALPTGFFRGYAVGDLADRALGIQQIRQILTGNTLRALLQGVFSLVSFAFLFWINLRLALIATVAVFVVAAIIAGLTIAQRRAQADVIRNQGALDGLTVQLVSAIGKLRVAAAERRVYAKWLLQLVHQKARERQVQRLVNVTEALNAAVPVTLSAVVFLAAAYILRDMATEAQLQALVPSTAPGATPEEPNVMTTADFLSFNAAFGQFLAGFLGVTIALSNLVEVRPLLDRARPILETTPDLVPGGRDPGTLDGNIALEDIVFRYSDHAPPVLSGFSMSIAAGSSVALVGPSGSGKSTVVRMLLGFEQPEAGAVRYDGQALVDLDTHAVRRQIGVVLQNGRITPGSLSSNIIGASGASLQEAWDAARMAGLAADIEAMPMGMHTVLVEGAQTLSGGQRQRLMIARALVGRPKILILDEATSALDNRTQALVSENLKRLGCTRVMIAHRLSTVRDADQIVVLDCGRVVQTGAYDTLIANPGPFQDLAKRQMAT